MGDATRWLTYDDMAAALGITPESAKRLAMRRKWPRRSGNDGRALVAVPEDRLAQAAMGDATYDGEGDDTGGVTGDVADEGRGDAKALIAFLERRIDVLTALLDVERTRVVEARAETEARVEAGRALLEAGRALLEAVRAERDRLLVRVDERRRP